MDFAKIGAFEAAALIKKGEISSEQLVKYHIDELILWNPKLNAICEDRFELALREAREKDEILSKTQDKSSLPILFGVPYTMKEMFSVAGMRSTLGSIHHKKRIMKDDATIVKRLKDAGAILLATTNVPEVGFWFETYNQVYGKTNNPYDESRTCGGSTGGEGAVIAAGASLFGVGSDIGGSIRIPAAFCGIYGHKVSLRMMPMTGHPPFYDENLHLYKGDQYPMTCPGPMSRRAKDLRPLVELLSGPDGKDPETTLSLKLKPAPKDIKSLKFYILKDPLIHSCAETDEEVSTCILKVANHFKQIGAQVTELPKDIFLDTLKMWEARLAQVKNRNFQKIINPLEKLNYTKEFLKWSIGKGNYTLPILIAGLIDKSAHLDTDHSRKKQTEALNELQNLDNKLKQILGDNGVILMPAHPRIAPKHYAPVFRPFDFMHTGVFNALGYPASVSPIDMSMEGLPLTVQIASTLGQDHLCLSVAEHLEETFGGWKKPAFS